MRKAALLLLVCGLGSMAPARGAGPEAVLFLTLSARVAGLGAGTEGVTGSGQPPEASPGAPSGVSVKLPARRAFRITSRPHDFEAIADGLLGQQVVVRFTAALLPGGQCGVADYEVYGLAKPGPNRPFGAGSTLQVNRTGFSLGPGQQVSRTIAAEGDSGTVVYTLDFRAVRVFGGERR